MYGCWRTHTDWWCAIIISSQTKPLLFFVEQRRRLCCILQRPLPILSLKISFIAPLIPIPNSLTMISKQHWISLKDFQVTTQYNIESVAALSLFVHASKCKSAKCIKQFLNFSLLAVIRDMAWRRKMFFRLQTLLVMPCDFSTASRWVHPQHPCSET